MRKVADDPYVEQARQILHKPYARRLVPESEGGFSASIQEFPGCFAEGDTAEEALSRLTDTAESWVAMQLARGSQVREPIAFFGASGKIALRIPRGLHQQVIELAESEDCSVNQLLTAAISEYVTRGQALKTLQNVVHNTVLNLQNVLVVVSDEWRAAKPRSLTTVTPTYGLGEPVQFNGLRSVQVGHVKFEEV